MEPAKNPVNFQPDAPWPDCLKAADCPTVQYVSQIPVRECIKVTIFLFLEQSKRSGDIQLAELARDIAKHAGIQLTIDG